MAQDYAPGHYIDISGNRVEGLVLAEKWNDTPQTFSFKKSESGAVSILTSDKIKSISVKGQRYELQTVEIDRSAENIAEMSKDRNPTFQSETLILQVLVDGDPALYMYKGEGIERFFYRDRERTDLEQLVYKPFLTGKLDENGNAISGENRQYLQQIFADYSRDGLTQYMIKDLRYKSTDLANVFVRINQFRSSEFEKFKIGKKKTRFSATIKLGYFSLLANGALVSPFEENLTFDFPNKGGLSWGVEGEYLLLEPSMLSIFIEANSFDYTGSAELEGGTITFGAVDLNSKGTNVTLGIKKYFPLANTASLFAKIGYSVPFDKELGLNYNRAIREPDKAPSGGLMLSAGVDIQNFIVEINALSREKLNYIPFEGELSMFLVTAYVGYKF